MKLLYILFGLGLAGVGLAAPAMEPYQIITTEDGIPIIQTNIVRIDTAIRDAHPSHPVVSQFSKLVSGTLGWLHIPGFRKVTAKAAIVIIAIAITGSLSTFTLGWA
ncbi:3-hydroxyacyl-CoA dehydrogenase [Purpureocillium lavendulum]|uniref:3-hydroxyacyl-CoA dehydrogenase n=1 Tax=Purpureocillium lavendulum TaxID=1247861 RepID=A0AB34FDJ0_9HYPO|nr:3-hydroxyacyl-CoA dehydrogenase [Purpureocillium lavendulum]